MGALELVNDWGVDAVLVASAAVAVWGDLRERRLYDWMTYPTLLLGLLLAYVANGFGTTFLEPGLRSAGAGCLALGGFFGAAWGLGEMLGREEPFVGLGDVKLMAAYGALFGFPAALGALMCVSLAGGVQGVLAVVARLAPVRRLLVRAGVRSASHADFGKYLPYGVAIAAGALFFRVWQRWPGDVG